MSSIALKYEPFYLMLSSETSIGSCPGKQGSANEKKRFLFGITAVLFHFQFEIAPKPRELATWGFFQSVPIFPLFAAQKLRVSEAARLREGKKIWTFFFKDGAFR